MGSECGSLHLSSSWRGGVFRVATECAPCSLQPGLPAGSIPPSTRASLPPQHFPEPAVSFAPVLTGPGQPMPSGHQVSVGSPSYGYRRASVSPDNQLWLSWAQVFMGMGAGCLLCLWNSSPRALGGASFTHSSSPRSACPGLPAGCVSMCGVCMLCMCVCTLTDCLCHVRAPVAPQWDAV